jgi:hypothetical protein
MIRCKAKQNKVQVKDINFKKLVRIKGIQLKIKFLEKLEN